MKFIYLFLCLFFCSGLFAQQAYELFRPGVTYTYDNPYYNSEEGRYQSILLSAEDCSETYHTIAATGQFPDLCYRVVPPFIGAEVCREDTVTILRVDETLYTLYSTASVGTEWVLAQQDTSTFIAVVDSIRATSVFGLADSVKYISFHRQLTDGNYEAEPLGASLQIGRNYGLLQGVFFWDLENRPEGLPIAGISEPELGLQNPTANDIYGFSSGDELHVREVYSYDDFDLNERINEVQEWVQRIITVDTNDTGEVINVEYSGPYRSYKTIGSEGIPFGDTLLVVDSSGYFATSLAYENSLPGEMVAGDFQSSYVVDLQPANGACQVTRKFGRYPLYFLDPNDDCNPYVFDLFIPDYFLEQRGGPYFSRADQDGSLHEREVVYSDVDGKTCGTPLDLADTPTGLIHSRQLETNISVYPNPSNGTFRLEYSGGKRIDRLVVVDIYGRVTQRFNSIDELLDLNPVLPAGTYTLLAYHGKELQGSVRWVRH